MQSITYSQDHLILTPHSQGQYQKALDLWDREKASGQADPSLYTVVMRVCEKLCSAEAAKAVREDMVRQGWQMDARFDMSINTCR